MSVSLLLPMVRTWIVVDGGGQVKTVAARKPQFNADILHDGGQRCTVCLGYYDPATQREVWDANPDALIASSIALAAGRGGKADGGFVINGRWPFSSAVDNSDWNMLAVSIYDGDGKMPVDWRLCLVSKADYEII